MVCTLLQQSTLKAGVEIRGRTGTQRSPDEAVAAMHITAQRTQMLLPSVTLMR